MKLGIIGAMQEELEPIAALLTHKNEQTRRHRSFVTGEIEGCPAVIATSGVGKVNAASAAQAMLSDFDVDVMINMGSSGGVSPAMEIGDLVIATDAIQYDVDLTAWGLVPGEVMYSINIATGKSHSQKAFSTDEKLCALAAAGAAQISMSPINGRLPTVHQGRVVSGDAFLNDSPKKRWLRETFDALASDMEAAAVAHVCALNHIPLLIVRAISDKGETHAAVDFATFLTAATRNYAGLIRYAARQLKDQNLRG
jgi:adenosylhomocysteine nucleosidase